MIIKRENWFNKCKFFINLIKKKLYYINNFLNRIIKSIQVEKGPNFTTTIEKQETELTADLLINGAWKNKKFKPYNFAALGATLEVGHLHPLLKVRSEFRKIFLEMGYVKEKIIFIFLI